MSIGIYRSHGSPNDVFTWTTKVSNGKVVTSYNIADAVTLAKITGTMIAAEDWTSMDDMLWSACLTADRKSLCMLHRTSYSGFNQFNLFVVETASTTWGDLGATYSSSTIDLDGVSSDYLPRSIIRLKSGALVAAFRYRFTDEGQFEYRFNYRTAGGVWQTPLSVMMPKAVSENVNEQATALIQHPNGEIYFFRHLQDDPAIGLIRLKEYSNNVILAGVNERFIDNGSTYPPHTGKIQIRTTVRPIFGTPPDTLMFAYPSNDVTTINGTPGSKLAFCYIDFVGNKTFNKLPDSPAYWLKPDDNFCIGVDGVGTTVWVAAKFLNPSGVNQFVTVGNFTDPTWTFKEESTFVGQLFPINDDFSSDYGGQLSTGFAWLDSGQLHFVPFSNYPAGVTGQMLWVKKIVQWRDVNNQNTYGGAAFISAVTTDTGGNVIAVGFYAGKVDFGDGFVRLATSLQDCFVVKYTPSGTVSWVNVMGGSGGDSAKGVTTDAAGNIFVCGNFGSTADFSGDFTGVQDISKWTSAGANDFFVVKYSPAGLHLCSKRMGGAYGEGFTNVATTSNGDIIFAGGFTSINADFGNGFVLSALAGDYDVALVRLRGTDLTTLWAKRYGGSNSDVPNGICLDRDGNILVAGNFRTATNLGGVDRTSNGGQDGFVAKYSGTDGTYIWDKPFGGTAGDNCLGVASDPRTGNVFITGTVSDGANFGGGSVSSGVFLVGLNSAGGFLWQILTGSVGDYGGAVAIDGNGHLVIAGRASSALNFGNGWVYGDGSYCSFAAGFTVSGDAAAVCKWVDRSNISGGAGTGAAEDTLMHAIASGNYNPHTRVGHSSVSDGIVITSTEPTTSDAAFVVKYQT